MTQFLRGMSSHQRTNGLTQDWLTPPEILRALGPFDLDPCVPCSMKHDPAGNLIEPTPWKTATRMICKCENGLEARWTAGGWTFCNPPYGPSIGRWLAKLSRHEASTGGQVIALVFARTETGWFQDHVFQTASMLFFPAGRIRFYSPDGQPGHYTGGAPSVFIAYGGDAASRLSRLQMRGHHIRLRMG